MKVTYNWLKDFVDIKIPAQALADKLTMAGLEVKALEERDGDFVFEIEITSNRPDWLSVIGVAREVAAITGAKLIIPIPTFKIKNSKHESLTIEIEEKKDCPLYTGKIIRNVAVKPSPEWLKKRLELVGCRSVNNIVDITNYILFEYGEPLHAFDLDKLSGGEIVVRRAKKGEKITIIDGQQLELTPEILVIADTHRPVAVAGIMGGKDTEVSFATKNILLEAAVFNLVLVRRAKRALGLSSESAYRFERGVALGIVEQASIRAFQLIKELAGGEPTLSKSCGQRAEKVRIVSLSTESTQRILGVEVAPARIKKILEPLGFLVKGKNNFMVTVPSHRQDIVTEIDLIEEVARIYGYEHIPTSLPAVKPQITSQETRDLVAQARNILVGLGLNEAITYSLIDRDLLQVFGVNELPIEILNPLSKDQEILRPALIPSLVRSVAHNLNQKQDYVALFEIASVFLNARPQPKEELRLAIALCGVKSLLREQGLVKEEVGVLHLKGIIETLFERLGIKGDLHTQENPVGIYAGKERVGTLHEVAKAVAERMEIKNRSVCALELSLEKVFPLSNRRKKFVPSPKYPGIERDISCSIKEDVPAKELLQAIKEKAGTLLQAAEITDYYKGKQIEDGYRGLTISCLYRSEERTLTEEEINPLHAALCGMLVERFGAKIR